MATETTEPVVDSVPKVNDELAVGEDLEFQRKWWRFENAVWIFFALLILLDLLGVFGRGPLANARAETSDGSMQIQYERVERFSTPSLLTIRFGASAIRDQKCSFGRATVCSSRWRISASSRRPPLLRSVEAGYFTPLTPVTHRRWSPLRWSLPRPASTISLSEFPAFSRSL